MPPERFFAATVLGGCLHVPGIPDADLGKPRACIGDRRITSTLVLSTTRERKVRTTEELEAAIKEPMTVAPTRNVWVHESLEDEAQ